MALPIDYLIFKNDKGEEEKIPFAVGMGALQILEDMNFIPDESKPITALVMYGFAGIVSGHERAGIENTKYDSRSKILDLLEEYPYLKNQIEEKSLKAQNELTAQMKATVSTSNAPKSKKK